MKIKVFGVFKMFFKVKKKLRKLFYKGPTKSLYSLASKIKIKYYSRLSDEDFLAKNLKQNTGLDVNFKNPELLYEKVLWIKSNYRNPLMTECTDKYEVRKYIQDKGYDYILTDIIGVYEDFDDINFHDLPDKVFLKSTHASGINQIVEKNRTDLKMVRKIFKDAKKINYFYKSREWNYKNVKPRILVEPFLDMTQFNDYKFFVINGKVEYFAVVKDINDDKGNQNLKSKFNLYNLDFEKMQTYIKRERFDDSNFIFSKRLKEIMKIAEDLAEPFPFCRVDFLVSENDVKFGEITFFPNGGNMVLSKHEEEIYYGKKLDLSQISEKYIRK